MTEGFEVFVHEVIAAMTTDPSVTPPIVGARPATAAVADVASATCVWKASFNGFGPSV
jgi:hypothetical protein